MGEKEGLQVNMVLYSPAMSMAAPGMAVHHSAFPSFVEWVNGATRTLQRSSHPLFLCIQDLYAHCYLQNNFCS